MGVPMTHGVAERVLQGAAALAVSLVDGLALSNLAGKVWRAGSRLA
jgi:hypothetical protein